MANTLNNVDLDKLSLTIEVGRKDKAALKKPIRLQGEWNLDESREYQFRTELAYGSDNKIGKREAYPQMIRQAQDDERL